MNIAIIGIGGVGGYFGGKLTQLLESDKSLKIYFIARGKHLEEIKKNGLILDSSEGIIVCKPTLATDSIEELPPLDICIICVKGYDLENVVKRLKPKITDKTIILPLLNGVDVCERIRAVITNGIVLPACVYIGTHIEKPGTVAQRGGEGTIIFGNDPLHDEGPDKLVEILARAGIKYKWTSEPYVEIWSKFIFVASYGLVTTNYNKTIGEVTKSKELAGYAKDIMAEIMAVAAKKNVNVPHTLIKDTFTKAKAFPFETKTSFQRDYETPGKNDERDFLGGAVIRLGRETGVKIPVTESIYASILARKTMQ
jgi:2-dehydropantoate 2-reductase